MRRWTVTLGFMCNWKSTKYMKEMSHEVIHL